MAHSSTSPSNKTQTFKHRATFQPEKIELVAEISRNHQQKIELSINNFKRKRRNITQEKMAVRNQPGRNQTKDLKCATHLLSDKFRNMSEEKKTIVRDLGFGGLMHIPPLRVHHQVLRELANNFKLGENRLETGYSSFKITPRKIGDALGINATRDLFPQKVDYKKLSEDDKLIFRRFQGKTLKSLTDEMMDIGVEKTDSDSSTSESETQEDSEDSPRKQPSKKGKKMDSKKRKKSQEDSDSDSESKSSDESEESSPVEKQKKKKKTQRTPKKTQSEKKKVVVEHSSPEEDQYYDGERYEIGSEDLDELLRGIDEKSAAEGTKLTCDRQKVTMSPLKPSEPADSNMMVVREQTPSQTLAIVPIQVFVPVSQTTTVPEFEKTPETDFEPTPLLQIEGTTKTTPEPPQQLQESTPTFPPAPTKIYPAAEDAAVLLMMARSTPYAPRTDQIPSFSLGLTDSSQEEASTQEGASTLYLPCASSSTRQMIKGFKNKYTVSPPDILNMAISKHPNGEFISPKTNKEFRVEDYPSFIPFIDAKKLTSHPYEYVISRMRAYVGGEPLKKGEKEKEIKASYVKISGQKSTYDCDIYVMKWLELIEPKNIKKGKYEWDNWKQDEVDHYRVEYASRILFNEMSKERDEAIRASNAIRLSKPSSILLSPFCQINSTNIENV
ncbi:hypothetical protein Ahy_A01g003243 [Arachis hypogaea]|uniref:Ubiquitin-like protease family profile domain-containing protein n=1 Tax=Arachis hypogaea TaxID=3818 RepID=A0A445ESV0_ARAHY|nr:hypothetical protein Ahy_A01g003243 [Arachis hypogaea]